MDDRRGPDDPAQSGAQRTSDPEQRTPENDEDVNQALTEERPTSDRPA